MYKKFYRKWCPKFFFNLIFIKRSLFWKCVASLLLLVLITSEVNNGKNIIDPNDPNDPSDPNNWLNLDPELKSSFNWTSNFIPPDAENGRTAGAEDSKKGLPIRNYFRVVATPTGICRKLARFGGTIRCRRKDQNFTVVDGDKMICVDPEMKIISSTKTEDCTVLSFGISLYTSFDQSIREANCQVHMFDILDVNPGFDDKFMKFHKIGLGKKNEVLFYTSNNITVETNSMDYIIQRFNLSKKLINILKIDIEGGELNILNQLSKTNILSSVGQIAVEIHTFGALNKTNFNDINIRKYTEALLQLEKIGFRRVSYFGNIASSEVKDEIGDVYNHAGELLLINSNWYKNKLKL